MNNNNHFGIRLIILLSLLLMFSYIAYTINLARTALPPQITQIEITIAPTEPELTPELTPEPAPEPTPEPTEPEINYTVYDVPEKYNIEDMKSFMGYDKITAKSSPQYKLQKYADTASDGIRTVNGRYCIALGSYFTHTIGQYVDIVLENGVVIECILGDQKSDRHTDAAHIAHRSDGSVLEFVVDETKITQKCWTYGSISYAHEEWKSPVAQVIVYDINFFELDA